MSNVCWKGSSNINSLDNNINILAQASDTTTCPEEMLCNERAFDLVCWPQLLNLSGICVTDDPNTGNTIFTTPTGFKFNQARANNAIAQFNSQFPDGSLLNYLEGLARNVGQSVSNNVIGALATMLIGMVLQCFIFYLIVITLLWICECIDFIVWFVFLIIGIEISVIVLAVIGTELAVYGTTAVSQIEDHIGDVRDTITCAFQAAVCCYGIGASCCCSTGSGATCGNPTQAPPEPCIPPLCPLPCTQPPT